MLFFLSEGDKNVIHDSFSPDDRSYFLMAEAIEEGQPVSPFILNYSGPCRWYDPDFRDYIALTMIVLLNAAEQKARSPWSAVVPTLLRGYGAGGYCPTYIAGVALLHASLTVSADPRNLRTRRQLDELTGADPGWLRYVYDSLGQARAFEGRPMLERLAAPPGNRQRDRQETKAH
jgi:hypothetical protein